MIRTRLKGVISRGVYIITRVVEQVGVELELGGVFLNIRTPTWRAARP